MVPVESFSYGWRGVFRKPTAEEHSDLTGQSDVLGATLTGHVRESDVVEFRNRLLYLLDTDARNGLLVEKGAEELFRHGLGNGRTRH